MEGGRQKVGWVEADVNDGGDAAGSKILIIAARGFVSNNVDEGLDEKRGDVRVGVPSSAEVGVELFDVVVSHCCAAV